MPVFCGYGVDGWGFSVFFRIFRAPPGCPGVERQFFGALDDEEFSGSPCQLAQNFVDIHIASHQPVSETTTTTLPWVTILTWRPGLSGQSGPDLSGILGEAGSQPGVGKGSVTGPTDGRPSGCSEDSVRRVSPSFGEGRPTPRTPEFVQKILQSTLHSCRAAPRSPKPLFAKDPARENG